MILLADESVDGPIVRQLRDAGYDVDYVAEMSPGIDDERVMERANRGCALLMTTDKDFGEMVFRQGKVARGVVLIRLAGLTQDLKARLVKEALQSHGEDMSDAFTVISPGLVRIRRRS